jgi:precorrin-6B methylase 2
VINFQAFKYYFSSFFTLINNFNFWVFPSLLFKKEVLIKIKNDKSYWVSNLMDIWTLKEVVVDKQYEVVRKIRKGSLVVDIGGAIGEFTIRAAQKASKVVVYECDEERLELMNKNLKLNKIKNVTVKAQKASSLNKILNQIKFVDFLKIDCEGCEYQLFKNIKKETLAKIKFIAMEAHQFDPQMQTDFLSLIKLLRGNGFQANIVKNKVHDYICFVFVSKK